MGFDFNTIQKSEDLLPNFIQVKLTLHLSTYTEGDLLLLLEGIIRKNFNKCHILINDIEYNYRSAYKKIIIVTITLYEFYHIFYALHALLDIHTNAIPIYIDKIFIDNSDCNNIISKLDFRKTENDKKLGNSFLIELCSNVYIKFRFFNINEVLLLDFPVLKTYFSHCRINILNCKNTKVNDNVLHFLFDNTITINQVFY